MCWIIMTQKGFLILTLLLKNNESEIRLNPFVLRGSGGESLLLARTSLFAFWILFWNRGRGVACSLSFAFKFVVLALFCLVFLLWNLAL